MTNLLLAIGFISLVIAPALLTLLTPSAGEEVEVRHEAWHTPAGITRTGN